MNERQAILAAADEIEREPDRFDFRSVAIPDCGSPGCALGWIAACLGWREAVDGVGFLGRVSRLLGHDNQTAFYKAMSSLDDCWKTKFAWSHSASECAARLRLYADKYHPAADAIPAAVRAIFDHEAVEERA